MASPAPYAASRVTITMQDGTTYRREDNVWTPLRDLDLQWRKLEAKFRALVDPVLGADTGRRLVSWCRHLEAQQELDGFWTTPRGDGNRA